MTLSEKRCPAPNRKARPFLGRTLPFIAALILGLAPFSASAHRPHDDVQHLEIIHIPGSHPVGLAVVRSNLLRSETLMRNWSRVTNGLDISSEITALIAGSRAVYLSTARDGIFRSDDTGLTWSRFPSPPETAPLKLLAVGSDEHEGLVATEPDGALWISSGPEKAWSAIAAPYDSVTAAAFVDETRIALGTDTGMLLLLDLGNGSVTALCSEPFGASATDIEVSPGPGTEDVILMATAGEGIIRASRNGSGCHPSLDIPDPDITALSVVSGGSGIPVMFATARNTVMASTDRGITWEPRDAGLKRSSQAEDPRYSAPHFRSLKVFEGSAETPIVAVGGFAGLFVSDDLGSMWHEVETLPANLIMAMAVSGPDRNGSHLVGIGTYGAGVLFSGDHGRNWIRAEDGLPDQRIRGVAFAPTPAEASRVLTQTSGALLAAPAPGEPWANSPLRPEGWSAWLIGHVRPPIERMMRANDAFARLMNKYAPRPDSKLTTHPTILAVSDDGQAFVGTSTGEIYRIAPPSRSPEKIGDFDHGEVVDLAIVRHQGDLVVYASMSPFVEPPDPDAPVSLMRYSESEGGWGTVPLGPEKKGKMQVEAASLSNGKLSVAVGWSGGMAVTEDDGRSWRHVRVEEGNDAIVDAMAMSPTYSEDGTIYLSSRGRGLFVSQDFGVTFRRVGEKDFPGKGDISFLRSFPAAAGALVLSADFASSGTIYATTGHSVFVSRDRGSSWNAVVLPQLSESHR